MYAAIISYLSHKLLSILQASEQVHFSYEIFLVIYYKNLTFLSFSDFLNNLTPLPGNSYQGPDFKNTSMNSNPTN